MLERRDCPDEALAGGGVGPGSQRAHLGHARTGAAMRRPDQTIERIRDGCRIGNPEDASSFMCSAKRFQLTKVAVHKASGALVCQEL